MKIDRLTWEITKSTIKMNLIFLLFASPIFYNSYINYIKEIEKESTYTVKVIETVELPNNYKEMLDGNFKYKIPNNVAQYNNFSRDKIQENDSSVIDTIEKWFSNMLKYLGKAVFTAVILSIAYLLISSLRYVYGKIKFMKTKDLNL